MKCEEVLNNHSKLMTRSNETKRLVDKIRTEFESNEEFKIRDLHLTVFCAGSLARKEAGKKSDWDVFIIADKKITRLKKLKLLSALININAKLKFPEFSNDGEYLRFYSIDEITSKTGSPRDDYENFFTARMLYLLESSYLHDQKSYDVYMDKILSNYFRDEKGKKSFKPLFILNDLLRYWRTLCLNYEEKRNKSESEIPWRKKNINLKFSRMLTVFSTVLPMIAKPVSTQDEFKTLTEKTPLERMAYGLDALGDGILNEKFNCFLNNYEKFLGWKEQENPEKYFSLENNKKDIADRAKEFSDFIYSSLNHKKIDKELKKYLVI